MSNQETATCVICGKKYKVCLSCKDQIKLKPWRSIADTIDCYKIFLAVTQYNNGYISKDEAKKQLETIKFNKNDLSESVRNKINEIMSGSPVSTEHPKKMTAKNATDKKCEE